MDESEDGLRYSERKGGKEERGMGREGGRESDRQRMSVA